jgi:hypothetical protein
VLKLVKNHLRRLNLDPKEIELIDIGFSYTFHKSEKERIEIEKMQAEKDKIVIETWEKLTALDIEKADKYLIDNGFGFMI